MMLNVMNLFEYGTQELMCLGYTSFIEAIEFILMNTLGRDLLKNKLMKNRNVRLPFELEYRSLLGFYLLTIMFDGFIEDGFSKPRPFPDPRKY